METGKNSFFIGSKVFSESRNRMRPIDCFACVTIMKGHPIHQNLSTSFVDLSSLVRYLHGLQFVGRVHVELSSYEAEIFFTPSKKMRAREHDHIAGRMSEGEQALKRILIRAKEPHGLIHVFQADEVFDATGLAKIVLDESIAVKARETVFGRGDKQATHLLRKRFVTVPKASEADLDTAIGLAGEIVRTIDRCVSAHSLDFKSLFWQVCKEASVDNSFLDPSAGKFVYRDGNVHLRHDICSEIFVTAISGVIARLFKKLREEPVYGNLHHAAAHRVRLRVHSRQDVFDKFGYTSELRKIISL